MHYDPSYLSKIRTGKRNPAHHQQFIEKICEYVASNYKDEQDRKKVAYLIQCNEDELADSSSYRRKLREWLSSSKPEDVDYVSAFLRKVDSFNLDDYIRAIHFDSFKVPKVPFQLPVSRHYYGLKEMREGELDFFHLEFAQVKRLALGPTILASGDGVHHFVCGIAQGTI